MRKNLRCPSENKLAKRIAKELDKDSLNYYGPLSSQKKNKRKIRFINIIKNKEYFD